MHYGALTMKRISKKETDPTKIINILSAQYSHEIFGISKDKKLNACGVEASIAVSFLKHAHQFYPDFTKNILLNLMSEFKIHEKSQM
jgi:hypothetical protein